MSSEFEVQVTEEFEVVHAEVVHAEVVHAEAARPEMALRLDHSSPDRTRARELFERLAELPAGDPERARIRGYLVELHLPLVEYLARRFRNRGEWLDDLTQVATIGLIKSIDPVQSPTRGVEFSTYATPTIVGKIKRHFRDKGWAVRPRRLQELKLRSPRPSASWPKREGRAPTVSELADGLGE